MARRRVVQVHTISPSSTEGASSAPAGARSHAASSVMRSVRGVDARQMAADLLDLVAPRDCVGCSRPGRTLCPTCARGLQQPTFVVDRLDRPVVAAGWLDGALGRVVRGYKSGAGRCLVDPMAERLQAALAHPVLASSDVLTSSAVGIRPLAIVAIPLSLRARWIRGEDVWGRVVQRAVARMQRSGSPPVFVPALEPVRAVRDQRHLGAAARAVNVTASLRVRDRAMPGDPDRYDWIIADDVVTTGATLREAVRALLEVVPPQRLLGAAVVAATRSST